MGQELGSLFHALSVELTWLSWTYQEFRELFAEGSERLNLLNDSAPFFFHLVQRTWWEDLLLGISRMMGPQSSRGKANLSAMRLPELLAPGSLREKVADRLQQLSAQSEFANAWRHKHIAHRDLERAISDSAVSLPVATIADVGAILVGIAETFNLVEHHYTNGTTAYLHSPITLGARSLIYLLRDARRLEELRQDMVERGDYDPRYFHDGEPRL